MCALNPEEDEMNVSKIFLRLAAILGVAMMFAVSGWGACSGTAQGSWTTSVATPFASDALEQVKSNQLDYYTIAVNASGIITVGLKNRDTSETLYVNFYSGNTCSGTPLQSLTLLPGAANQITRSVTNTESYSIETAGSVTNAQTDYNLTMHFSNANQPMAVNDSATVYMNKSKDIEILSNDVAGINPIDPATVVLSVPAHGSVDYNSTTKIAKYTPTTNYLGADSFTYTVKDTLNNISNTATVTLTVVVPTPIAYDKFYSVSPGATIQGNIITDPPIDEDIENNLTVYAHTNPSVGTLTLANGSNGDFNYTAPAAVGSTTFTYSIKNMYNVVSATATVTIFINEYCTNAITLLTTDTNCTTSETNTTSTLTGGVTGTENGVTSSSAQYYKFILAENGVLDVNLTNEDPQNGGTILYYDFGDNCAKIFGKGTTSQVDAGYRSSAASIPLNAGTYYLGVVGKSNVNTTDYSLSVTFNSTCPGGGGGGEGQFTYANVGINEPGINYDIDKNITTKIVNKPFGLHASYLNSVGAVATYDGAFNGKTVDMTVILSLADDECVNPQVIGQGIITSGTSDTLVTPLNIANAAKIKQIGKSGFDYGKLFRDASGLNCGTSALNSSLCLVPACFNNIQNIRSVFPPAFLPHVMICIYGDGSGLAAPCDSNAYYGNCGGKQRTISPAKYNNDLGCAMCLVDALGGNKCEDDRFAIRPKAFDVNVTSGTVFKAGELKALVFKGNDENNVPSNGYNENENTSFIADVNVTNPAKICQEPSFHFSPSIAFVNGLDNRNFKLNNVGDDLNLSIHEILTQEFALIDEDDTNVSDRLITGFNTTIKVIPHHFGIDGNLTNGSNGFTYLSNFRDYNTTASRLISAPLDVKISGQTDSSIVPAIVTTNYTEQCYAKDGNLSITLANPLVVSPAGNLNSLLWYYANDYNATKDRNGSFPIGGTVYPLDVYATQFDSNESNGTAHIKNFLNFDRNETRFVDPMLMVVDNLDTDNTDLVHGSVALAVNKSAYYVYGRVNPLNITVYGYTEPINAQSYMEVYSTVPSAGLGLSPSRMGVNWWVNNLHTLAAYGDANVTVNVPNTIPLPVNNPLVAGVTMYTWTPNPFTAPTEFESHITTMPWLWYGANALPYQDPAVIVDCMRQPCFNVKVRPTISKWVGGGDDKGNKAQQKSTTDETMGEDMLLPRIRQ